MFLSLDIVDIILNYTNAKCTLLLLSLSRNYKSLDREDLWKRKINLEGLDICSPLRTDCAKTNYQQLHRAKNKQRTNYFRKQIPLYLLPRYVLDNLSRFSNPVWSATLDFFWEEVTANIKGCEKGMLDLYCYNSAVIELDQCRRKNQKSMFVYYGDRENKVYGVENILQQDFNSSYRLSKQEIFILEYYLAWE